MTDPLNTFNRTAVQRHRDRAAKNLSEHDFLFVESAERLADRLDDINRAFPLALDLGCHGGDLARCLAGRGGIKSLVQTDLSSSMAKLATSTKEPTMVCDEEALPFVECHFDLVLSNLNLHWVNDLPGSLVQILNTLKPDGLFMAALFGGSTLHELRTAMYQAETELENGLSPRVSPPIDVRDLGNLMVRTGFALPVVDADIVTVYYSDPLKLLRDLRGMGETNASNDRRRTFSRRSTIQRACDIYLDTFATKEGKVPATFEILTITAWAPSPNQQKPLKPGTAKIPLADALRSKEMAVGEKILPD